MKAITSLPSELITTSSFIKITAFSLLSLSILLLCKHFSDSYQQRHFSFFSSSSTTATPTANDPLPPPLVLKPGHVDQDTEVEGLFASSSTIADAVAAATASTNHPPPPPLAVERTGIVDENGVMSADFEVGEFDPSIIESVANESQKQGRESGQTGRNNSTARVRVEKYRACNESMRDYIPCLDNVDVISRLNSTERGEKFERHCPEGGKGLDCVVPRPEGYKLKIPWPKSRDEVWFSNVPHTRLVEDKGGQNWISKKEDKFIFPGGGTQFIHGADQYLDQISKMVPDIAFGLHTRVALDVGCGVASFGAFLLGRNVTTLSIAPKDVHENQIQFALERGVPAMLAAFATRRLLYPSQAFDLIHCSRCRINWTRDDGILLLEVNRMLRAGGYFVWAAQPVYKHEDKVHEQWKEMEDLTGRICWELVKKEGYIAIWRKPLNNSCYLNRAPGVHPLLCDSNDDPDNVWYVDLKACITRLPENGYGANVTTWPARLHLPPDRLFSIKMDAYMSRKEIFKAESKYRHDIVDSYVSAFHLKELELRNVMDMRAGYGGFAAAFHDLQIDCWVMNVVPVSSYNTLPVIYDRGLIGVLHDWCEPFDTYPRTYDLLNAAGLFSVEQKRCNISTIILEMDRILRPGGRAYIRDTVSVCDEVHEIANAVGWVVFRFDTGEGPHSNWKHLVCEKRL
ncbi:probable methyltransferase PMT10 [Cornus florida]|uniref:probable methyltransferase PMT10 n=1 Tax=Cornus florida TaxID=4283 RepID=UPI0028A1C17D|nr:probable methyltransferase PMT10 [Cornus florida]